MDHCKTTAPSKGVVDGGGDGGAAGGGGGGVSGGGREACLSIVGLYWLVVVDVTF